jgi:hypothetical protein
MQAALQQLAQGLDPAAAHALAARRGRRPSLLRQAARDFTEDLAVYSASRRSASRLEQWNKGLQLDALR